jgi:hypothetical protein
VVAEPAAYASSFSALFVFNDLQKSEGNSTIRGLSGLLVPIVYAIPSGRSFLIYKLVLNCAVVGSCNNFVVSDLLLNLR